MNTASRKALISLDKNISIRKQCNLLNLSRSTFYYKPCEVSAEDLLLMRLIDKEYTEHPFYGSRRFQAYLQRLGYRVCRDKVRSLMRQMGIEAVYQKPRLSIVNSDHLKYPYLLRGIIIDHCNQVWSTDITYIPMQNGFLYLTTVID